MRHATAAWWHLLFCKNLGGRGGGNSPSLTPPLNYNLLSQQAHAAPAIVASVGAALCLKNHFFFHVKSYWGSPKFFHVRDNFCPRLGTKKNTLLYWGSTKFFWGVTIFARDWAQKKHLAILRQHKIFLRRDNFCPRLGTKTSLTKLILKHSILKQYLPNSQHYFLSTSQYKGYIEPVQKFLRHDNFCPRLGTKNFPHLIGSKKLSSEWIFAKFSA